MSGNFLNALGNRTRGGAGRVERAGEGQRALAGGPEPEMVNGASGGSVGAREIRALCKELVDLS
eukprot:8634238-Pyramimonas_sp.AAC.1